MWHAKQPIQGLSPIFTHTVACPGRLGGLWWPVGLFRPVFSKWREEFDHGIQANWHCPHYAPWSSRGACSMWNMKLYRSCHSICNPIIWSHVLFKRWHWRRSRRMSFFMESPREVKNEMSFSCPRNKIFLRGFCYLARSAKGNSNGERLCRNWGRIWKRRKWVWIKRSRIRIVTTLQVIPVNYSEAIDRRRTRSLLRENRRKNRRSQWTRSFLDFAHDFYTTHMVTERNFALLAM